MLCVPSKMRGISGKIADQLFTSRSAARSASRSGGGGGVLNLFSFVDGGGGTECAPEYRHSKALGETNNGN